MHYRFYLIIMINYELKFDDINQLKKISIIELFDGAGISILIRFQIYYR